MPPDPHGRSRLAVLLSIIAVLLGGGGLTVAIALTQGDDGAGHKTTSVHVKVNEKSGDGAPTTTLNVPAPLIQSTQATFPDKAMHDETPPLAEQVAPGQLTAAQAAAARIRAHQAPLPTAGASAGFKGCLTRFVVNQSSRNGVRPQDIVYHYTVSHNVAGWADMASVLGLFSRSSAQASSNFLIDAEGHCYYMVPIEAKAWTQAAFNPFAVSFEIVAYGNEATYLASPGYLKLAQVSLEVSKRTGIPLVRGAVSGCVPARKGIIQHADLGICGGGHHDIEPFSINQVIKIVQGLAKGGAPISHRQVKRCRTLNHLRRQTIYYRHRHGRPGGRRLTRRERRLVARIKAGERRFGLRCRVNPKHGRHLIRV